MTISFQENTEEKKIISNLDQLLKDEPINKVIALAISQAEQKLVNGNKISITEAIPLNMLGSKLPKEIGLCRIFILRANTESKVERHTNSIQRVMSYKNTGNIKVLINDQWVDNPLKSTTEHNLESRWLTVLENTWHQPIAHSEHWGTVTFHTADKEHIIDEYKD